MASFDFRSALRRGLVIPAHPLALDSARRLDERRQRALSRYYIAAGAGGLAVGVHTTQFAIHDPGIGLYEPVLALAAEEMDRAAEPLVRIGGICGDTRPATTEAGILRRLGFHAGLLSLASLATASDDELISHVRDVGEVIPIVGFYLQPAVGGRVLSYSFWRRLAEVESVVAIKIAPFNRYQTLDVIRAVAESGRDDIALYTGNDDNIVGDLVTPYRFGTREIRIAGGLLGHWSVWTRGAVELLHCCRAAVCSTCAPYPVGGPDGGSQPTCSNLLRLGIEMTDCNAAFFDAAHGFRGCIPGLHEVLRRQRLLEGVWCLDETETLSPGQLDEINRVYRAYPHLNDDEFVESHRDEWLRP